MEEKQNDAVEADLTFCRVNVAFDSEEEEKVQDDAEEEEVPVQIPIPKPENVKRITFKSESESIGNGNGSCYPSLITPPEEDMEEKVELTNFMNYHQNRVVVRVRNGVKRYGRNGELVLNGFNMTVESGKIYSLLGASGCGKTTALTCILGIRHLQFGSITVFGKAPFEKGSGVPGHHVGYMPQEVALYGDFSIDETLRYYGNLYGMTEMEIKVSRDFLMSFLRLPDETRRVAELSVGQKRRVSLAISLIHSPPLLILDEPTVGVDALLREKIWAHLVDLVKKKNTCVIITTHYIEEARHSNTIGIMRGGRLLAENDPVSLMKKHDVNLLEDIVLKLCRTDRYVGDEGYKVVHNRAPRKSLAVQEQVEGPDWDWDEWRDQRKLSLTSRLYDPANMTPIGDLKRKIQRIRALILKNSFVMWRNLFLVIFMILTPSIMVLLICNGIGNDPHNLKLGVVNLESNATECARYREWRLEENGGYEEDYDEGSEDEGCNVEYLSCKYLRRLSPDLVQVPYESVEEAREGVAKGDTWGYLAIPENYSDCVFVRASSGNRVDEDSLLGSFITYQLDMTNKLIGGHIKKKMGDAYEAFIKAVLRGCSIDDRLGDPTVLAQEPIYGKDDTDLREFIAPSLLVGFLFFFPLCSTSVQYIYDKKLGTNERARVAGVNTSEIMISYFVTESIVLTVQLACSLAIIVLLFGFEIKGSFLLTWVIYMLMGFGGVSMGFLFASFLSEEVEAVLLAMASFFPNFLLSGLLWPVEGMPYILQYITILLPATYPAETVRSLISRGWEFSHIRVWPGYVAISLWITIYWIATILIHKIVLGRK